MIIDSIENIELYREFPFGLYDAISFIKVAKPDISIGEYEICENIKAIISEYNTVKKFLRGYEAHRNTIDVQYPIIGNDLIKWSPLKTMMPISPYDSLKDRTFYNNPSQMGTDIIIGSGVFAVMFPQDAHSPQHYIDKPESIKKITVKINI